MKQRLVAALELELVALEPADSSRLVYECYLRALRWRGSGPLPGWARDLARDRKIV